MIEQGKDRKLHKPEIANNGYDGYISILIEGDDIRGVVGIRQLEEYVIGEKVHTRWRMGWLEGDLYNLLDIAWIPGSKTGGKVVIKEQYDPPVLDDPERFLKWKNGKVCRVDGRPVYMLQYYTFKALEPDILIQDPADSEKETSSQEDLGP